MTISNFDCQFTEKGLAFSYFTNVPHLNSYREDWYTQDLGAGIDRANLGRIVELNATRAEGGYQIRGVNAPLGSSGSRDLLRAGVEKFDPAAALYAELDTSTNLCAIPGLVHAMSSGDTCFYLAARIHYHQSELFISLLKQWDAKIDRKEFWEANRALDRIELKLRCLEKAYPQFRDVTLPLPCRRPFYRRIVCNRHFRFDCVLAPKPSGRGPSTLG